MTIRHALIGILLLSALGAWSKIHSHPAPILCAIPSLSVTCGSVR